MNRKSLLALLLSGLILFGGTNAVLAFSIGGAGTDFGTYSQYISGNSLDFGGFSNFVGAAGEAGLSEAEAKAVIVALINAKFGEEDFLTVLRESNATAADKLAALATANPKFRQLLDGINTYAKTSEGKDDLKKIQDQVADSETSDNTDKTEASILETFRQSVLAQTDTDAVKEKFISDMEKLGYSYNEKTGNLVDPSGNSANDANNYLHGSVLSTDDTSACDEAFGVGWLSDGSGSSSSGGSSGASASNECKSSGAGCSTNSDCCSPLTCASGVCAAVSAACNTYTYNDWGSCAGGSQNRTIFSKGPAGCTDTSSAQLAQSCAVSCASYIYNDWSACSNGSQSRTIKTQSPAGCTNTSTADLTNECTGNSGVACTSYTYGDWSACANNSQSRTIVSQSPSGCANTSTAVLTQSCAVQTVACASYTYSDWSACVAGSQTRSMLTRSPSGCGDTSTATFTQSCNVSQPPLLANTTNAVQTSSSPVLSVTTDRAAVCQYAEAGGFTYGNGTTFNTTGGYNHNSSLANANRGAHTFYVICKDNATGGASAALKIDFNVSLPADPATTTDDCASLSSNDRRSDANRSNSGGGDADSSYLWQSVEAGTRERFSKVDWYAGYQFTPEKDGRITQLCGYFESGGTNKVSVYNGSYAEIASAQVAGNGAWKCVDISPLAVDADSRYYVIARVQNNPIYFEYKSGLLPRKSGNAVIEAGIRQTIINGAFKTDVVKYDYMIFGLVDVKISYGEENSSGPEITSVGPVGEVDGSSAVISAQTGSQSACRFDREDVSYSQMKYAFGQASAGNFSQKICGLESGNYTFYVRCKDAGGENNASKAIQFSISQ